MIALANRRFLVHTRRTGRGGQIQRAAYGPYSWWDATALRCWLCLGPDVRTWVEEMARA
jgi:hypothetical protein